MTPIEPVYTEVEATKAAMRDALRPEAAWTCAGCGGPKKRHEPFGADELREQVRHLPYSSSVINLALWGLQESGEIKADTRWRLTVVPDRMWPDAIAPDEKGER